MSNQKPNLGYIGLGMMGGPMALRLANADFPLSIWGRSPAKLEAAKVILDPELRAALLGEAAQ